MGQQESMTVDEGSPRMDGRSGDGDPGPAADGPGPGMADGPGPGMDVAGPGPGMDAAGPGPGVDAAGPGPGMDAAGPGPGMDAAGPGRLISRFRSLSRGRRLAITASAGVLAVVAAITAIGSTGGAAKAPPQPQAPAFTLSALGRAGGHISLAGFAGKPLIINFFASWCEPCQKETPLLAKFYRAAHGSITLIGVDANDKAPAALKFIHAAGVSYPVAFDPYPMHTTISFGVDALPQTFFLDARHRIVKLVRGAVTEQELKAGVAQITGQTRG